MKAGWEKSLRFVWKRTVAIGMALAVMASQFGGLTVHADTLRHLKGDLHSHTAYSDAAIPFTNYHLYPSEAIDAYKEAGYDFLGLSDHTWGLNSFGDPCYVPSQNKRSVGSFGISDLAWGSSLYSCYAGSNSSFTALNGYEYCLGDIELFSEFKLHWNVFNTDCLSRGKPDRYAANDAGISDFYSWVSEQPENIIVQFNHPQYWTDHEGADNIDKKYFDNFGHWAPELDKRINLIEYSSRECDDNEQIALERYDDCLKAGWHVAPTANTDYHRSSIFYRTCTALSGDAGYTKYNSRTIILSPTNCKADIVEAIKKHRVYATLDKNLEVDYSINNTMMGSSVMPGANNTLSANINIRSLVQNQDNKKITTVKIWSNNGEKASRIINSFSYNNLTLSIPYTPTDKYYYVRLYNSDPDNGGNPVVVTAPIWVSPPAWVSHLNDFSPDQTYNDTMYGNTDEYPIFTGDWNKDGKTDIGRVTKTGVKFYTSGDNNTWNTYGGIDNLGRDQGYTNATTFPILTGDWNGDGRTDIGRV